MGSVSRVGSEESREHKTEDEIGEGSSAERLRCATKVLLTVGIHPH